MFKIDVNHTSLVVKATEVVARQVMGLLNCRNADYRTESTADTKGKDADTMQIISKQLWQGWEGFDPNKGNKKH